MPLKRTGSSTSAVHQAKGNGNTNAAKTNNANFTLTRTADGDDDDDDDDDDEWVSSSGAQTPNHDDSKSDTASEGSGLPQELVQQLQRTQLEQQPVQELAAMRAQTPLSRVETARQSDFHPVTHIAAASVATSNVNGTPDPASSVPTQTPFPISGSVLSMNPVDQSSQDSQLQPFVVDHVPASSGTGGQQQQHVKKINHSQSESCPTHVKRQSITRPPSTHSVAGRLDSAPVRPHPLIRGHSQGYLGLVTKPTPLAPLTVTIDQPTSAPDGSPASAKSTGALSEEHTATFPLQRRTSFSSVRSVATLPAHSLVQSSHKPYDRTRTLSTLSTAASSTALNSLAHLSNVTRPPSPQLISFFPPVNPHVNVEAIHPLLPGPYLHNHLTVLARRSPLRESYNRVVQAKIASGSR